MNWLVMKAVYMIKNRVQRFEGKQLESNQYRLASKRWLFKPGRSQERCGVSGFFSVEIKGEMEQKGSSSIRR
ncbi:hypothetical protein DN757_26580 [Paenibacillus silvae]|uniref:Uncharacterized protein n=1 Tax=Paenibacillus silvae TaxID=1325358 RepID=A0A2W6NYX6_9BACL|nr:hypothetical protein DN757_26580 [Paenibacillus silvae]